MKVFWTNPALDDVRHHVDFLTDQSLELGLRFVTSVDTTCSLLATNPEIGERIVAIRDQHRDFRVWPIREFRKYLIFYRVVENRIIVVRVIHGSQYRDSFEF